MNGYRLRGRYGNNDYDRDLIIDLCKVWRVEAIDGYHGEDFYIKFLFSRDGKNYLIVKLPSRVERDKELDKILSKM